MKSSIDLKHRELENHKSTRQVSLPVLEKYANEENIITNKMSFEIKRN